MQAVVLNTGTELLLGDVRDAHLSFIAQQIWPLGLRVAQQRTVPDGAIIGETLRELFGCADIIFVTGGLGPTTDDITVELTAEVLQLELARDEGTYQAIAARLKKRGIPATERVWRQANVPKGAEVLPNPNGTAPGVYLRGGLNPAVSSPHIFLLPGPPRELQPMFRDHVTPILEEIVPAKDRVSRRVYKIANIGESIVEEAVGEKLLAIPGLELGYCARPGEVDLRIVGPPTLLEQANAVVREALGSSIFTSQEESLEETIVHSLVARKETLALAESCTGGHLANRITNVPGASGTLLAGYVTYANEAKSDVLGVPAGLIEKHGAVSEPVARAMAEGARKRAKATYAIATTGIAGPSGGSKDKPVGTVFVALSSPKETVVQKHYLPVDRETFKQMAAQQAFDALRQMLVNRNS